jgi:hypothetical protein
MPTASDLVTDLPADFETFGQAVATSMADLLGGTTGQVLTKASNTNMDFTWAAIDPLVILDAKGDLITATAADTPARLAVGTNGQVLTADSTAATGLAWAAASGGMTLLSTTAMSGTTTTVSSIPGGYTNLYIFAPSITFSSSAALRYKFNGSSYYYCEMTTYDNAVLRVTSPQSTVAPQSALSATNWGLNIVVPSYTSTLNKSSHADVLNQNGAASFIEVLDTNAAAVTSFSITSAAGSATLSGNIFVYGVK